MSHLYGRGLGILQLSNKSKNSSLERETSYDQVIDGSNDWGFSQTAFSKLS